MMVSSAQTADGPSRHKPWLWRPSWLQEPLMEVASRRNVIMGAQTHRLPLQVMWAITILTALGMAVINFLSILAIEYSVKSKFAAMQFMIDRAGLLAGIMVLTGISMCYALAGVCLIMFVAPNCSGSGLPENKCYLNGSSNLPGFFTKRTLRVRMACTILANAAGFPVGREGPTVVIGSNLAYLISQALAEPFVREWVEFSRMGRQRPALIVDEERFNNATRIACAVGGACGMAMIFNAPFGGLLYMFEEITPVAWPLELTFRVFVATMTCAMFSYALLNLMGSDIKEFVIFASIPQEKKWTWQDVPVFIVLSMVLGVLTSYHTRGCLAMASLRQRVAARLKKRQPCMKICETILYNALCQITSTLIALSASCMAEGGSELQYVRFNCAEGYYNPIASLLVNTSHSAVKILFSGSNGSEIHHRASVISFCVYYALNVGLTGLPVPGGAFTATMLLGGLFGRFVGSLGQELGFIHSPPGVYAVVGSAAMLCGFKQMTLAVVLIVVECVNDLTLAPIVMLSVAVSLAVNWQINERGHDEEQIHSKELPFIEGEPPRLLDDVVARQLCEPLPAQAVLPPDAQVSQVREALQTATVMFPVVAGEGASQHCLGIITRLHLEAAWKASCGLAGHMRTRSRAFVEDPFSVKEEESTMFRRSDSIPKGSMLPLDRIMDPTPFTIVEGMPAPRLYALFAKAGEKAACVVSKDGAFLGIITRDGLIRAARHGVKDD